MSHTIVPILHKPAKDTKAALCLYDDANLKGDFIKSLLKHYKHLIISPAHDDHSRYELGRNHVNDYNHYIHINRSYLALWGEALNTLDSKASISDLLTALRGQ